MKKFMLDLIVSANKRLSEQYVLLILTSSTKLPQMLPGQFAEVRVDGASNAFLRRAISIHYVDYNKNELWLLIQVVGPGTKRLSEINAGDSLNLLIPLGNSFTIPTKTDSKVVLIGGGVGVAPLLFLGESLQKEGIDVNFLLGARSSGDLLQLCEFERFGKVYTTTEDGSHGEKGYVTQHSLLQSSNFDYIYTCGPTPMMKAVAAYAAKTNTFCEVSLENTMACGFGTCLCCVTDTIDGHICMYRRTCF
jgi:dihydroorotate dehydrogenase electron transfer subunit